MEHALPGTEPVVESPFGAAAQFGTALLSRLPGWQMEFLHDGEHTYIVWTDGERMIYRVAGEA